MAVTKAELRRLKREIGGGFCPVCGYDAHGNADWSRGPVTIVANARPCEKCGRLPVDFSIVIGGDGAPKEQPKLN